MACEKTVGVKFRGGVGDRLFQLTAAMAIADQTGRRLVVCPLDMECDDCEHACTLRIAHRFLSSSHIDDATMIEWNDELSLTSVLSGLENLGSIDHVCIDGCFTTTMFVELLTPESHKYVTTVLNSPYMEGIDMGWLQFYTCHLPNVASIYIEKDNSINLHVYYEQAMCLFDAEQWFLVFSDDPAWCAQQNGLFGGRAMFFVPRSVSVIQIISLMGKCGAGCIVPNSVVPWWGSWLLRQNYPTSRIIMPRCWDKPETSTRPSGIVDIHLPDVIVI